MKLNKIFTTCLPVVLFCLPLTWGGTLEAQKVSKRTLKIQEIDFIENLWELAAEKARIEHKYIFVDLFAVWCGPCKVLKNTTFRDQKVASFFNKNFINLSIDGEKGKGAKLAEQWGVEAYPTLLIVDERGKVVHSTIGFIEARDLLAFGQKALAGKRR